MVRFVKLNILRARFFFSLIFILFFCGCAPEVRYISQKCQVNPPLKPNCADFENEFDCLKAKARYINAIEIALQKCL